MTRRAAVTFETVRELAHAFPGVEDGTSYGTAALRVKKKFMARLREDGDSVVFKVGFDEREMLMAAKPAVFYITDHYRAYPSVLLRLSEATKQDAANVVELAWKHAAPKRLKENFEAARHPPMR